MINIGIDIGGTNIKVGLIKEEEGVATILGKLSFPFTHCDYIELCNQLEEAIDMLLAQFGYIRETLASIGLAVPGSISQDSTTLLHAYNLGYHNVPIKTELEKHLDFIPVVMDNDANAAAVAELYGGAFSGKKSALLLTLGTGLGGGVILGGKVFNGGQNRGCEIGHLPFKSGGRDCTCGMKGCMETYTSVNWIETTGKEKMGDSFVSVRQLIEDAKAGQPIANEIFNEYADNLATMIAGLCSMLDPEVVAIGGGISNAGNILFDKLEKLVEERNFYREHYPVVPAKMGNDAGIIGASLLFKNNNL
ncbi:MAG: ROK family protein [Clostridia bacterium]|nr:ROK family protein [Clostridia bacterium]